MTTVIVVIFVVGYMFIVLENVTKVNKAAVALLLCVACWAIFAASGTLSSQDELNVVIRRNLGEAGTTLFYLIGAMTIVEVVDSHGGFCFVHDMLRSHSKKMLLWKVGLMTFVLSAVLDNLTTSIIMVMILRKIVASHHDRIWYASLIIIAANAGGAFSPIGDVTTIMLWNSNMITATGIIRNLFLPSLLAFIIPAMAVQTKLSGTLATIEYGTDSAADGLCTWQRSIILLMGMGGLCSVPVFHALTGLPAFVGILLALGLLWVATELMYRNRSERDSAPKRVAKLMSHIDLSTILFFLGILMSVAVLSESGILNSLGQWLDKEVGNSYLVTGLIGIMSSVIDNVPLVAGAMKMYAIDTIGTGPFITDGLFWQLLAYSAGTGGSLLIIGSAAGVVVMGLEKITFGWYLRHITPFVLLSYLSGILCYYLQQWM